MNKLRKWIINKLGGFTTEDTMAAGFKTSSTEVGDYWTRVFASQTLYIQPSDYTIQNAESIEGELANRLAAELLRRECIFFSEPVKDHDELRVTAQCNALKLRKRESHHMSNHLVFKEGK